MISKLMLLEQVTIQEKKQLLLNKGISQDIIDKLLQCDPTNKNKSDTDKVGSYTDWIVSRYLKDRTFNDFDKLQSQLQQYDKSKHKIPDKQEKNIGQFSTLDDLITFVNNNQDKLATILDGFVVKTETDHDMFYSKDFIIHVPHTEEQSIRLGSGTKWCTSQLNNNQFNEYYIMGYLFYITNKTKNQERYNLHLKLKYEEIEFADDKDKHLPYKLFNIVKQDNTLIPQIKKYFEYKNIKVTKQISAFLDCNTVYEVVQWYKQNINPNADIYFETDEQKIINILSRNTDQYTYIPNPTHQAQMQQVSTNGYFIDYIKNPDIDVQLQQVSQDGNQIKFISDPDKEVQLQQVNQNTYQIQWIKNPDIKVKLQQVSKNGYYIKYIKNPDIKVQLQQVSNDGYQIQYIENPDKEVQLQQVRENGYQIEHIKNPDKEVQTQQVRENGNQIAYIKNPDKELQLQQVSQDGLQIYYIENPDKDVQLQQVKQYPKQYFNIHNPDPEQKKLYNQILGIRESTSYISKLLDVN